MLSLSLARVDQFFSRRYTQTKKPRKVMLTGRQPSNWRFTLSLALAAFCVLICFAMAFPPATRGYETPAFYYLLTGAISLFLALLLVVYAFRYGKHREPVPCAKIRYFIRANGLFEEEIVIKHDYVRTGQDRRIREVTSSAIFFIEENADILTITARKTGNKYTPLLADLAEKLQALFQLPLEEQKSEVDREVYIFRKVQRARLDMSQGTPEQEQPINLYSGGKAHLRNRIYIDNSLYADMNKTPHMLVCGKTSSGKSFFLFHAILSALEFGADLRICDPKASDLSMLANVLGRDKVATTQNGIAAQCRAVYERMEERYKAIKGADHPENFGFTYHDLNLAPVILVLDEFAALQMATTKEEKATVAEINQYVRTITLKGRELGVFVWVVLQAASASNLGGSVELRDQLGVRIILGQSSQENLRAALGDAMPENPRTCSTGEGYVYVQGSPLFSSGEAKFFTTPLLDLEKVSFLERAKRLYEELAPQREYMRLDEVALGVNLGTTDE